MADVIVVDDEPDIRELVADCLSLRGHQVRMAADAAAFRRIVVERRPDLAVLDVNMPGEDGLSLARWTREHLGIGIVMLTAAGHVVDRVIGLEVGADDYVVKPFAPAELCARVDAVLRRRAADQRDDPGDGRVRIGRFTYEPAAGRLIAAGEPEQRLALSERELLAAFLARPGKVLSRDELLDLAPARGDDAFDRSIDNRVTRLRRKLEDDPSKPQLIRTIRGGGYMYVASDA